MSKEFSITPHTRTWRDISQPVRPRAMTGGGRRRMLMAGLRVAGFTAVLTSVGWGAWQVAAVLRHAPEKMSAVAKAAPVKDVLFITDGVLGHPWIVATLGLPKSVSLMELDLQKLRDRVLANGQVRTATLTRNFPDTLAVTISERSPVARIKAAFPGGSQKELLVARDGVVFHGVDFDRAMIETLPWLEGLTLTRQNGVFLPIPGMEIAAELLAKAKLEAEERYATWEIVSLARLASDGELEVKTRAGTRIVFGTREDYFRQLARLDLLLDLAAKRHPEKTLGKIDLTLGSQVSATFASATLDRGERAGVSLFRPETAQVPSSAFPHLQIELKREL